MAEDLLDGAKTVHGRRLGADNPWPGWDGDPHQTIARAACVVGETYTLYVAEPTGGGVCLGFFAADDSLVSRPRGYQTPPKGTPYTDVEVAPEGAAWVAASWADGIARPVLTAGGWLDERPL
nr:MAG TPA: hypothetical protein [Caudoviricetes sp.]